MPKLKLPWKARVVAVSCALGLLAGCGSVGPDAGTGMARVRFVEVAPSAPETDFYVNGTGTAYGLGFESFTSYLPVAPGVTSLAVHRAGRVHALMSAEATLNADREYTVVLSESAGGLQQRVLSDRKSAAPAGQAILRVVNAIHGLPGVVVHLAAGAVGTELAGFSPLPVPSGRVSGYFPVPAAQSYQLTAVAPSSDLTLPLASVIVPVESGAMRTVVLAGTVDHAGHDHALAFVLDDRENQ